MHKTVNIKNYENMKSLNNKCINFKVRKNINKERI